VGDPAVVVDDQQWPGPETYRGKRVVVIGSNNSAFDICGALWEHDADVTMVQRSSTHIVKSASLMDIGLGDLYSERAVESGVTTDKADMIFASLPYRIMHEFQIPLYEQMAERDADFYARLAKAGFWHDWGPDGSGLFMKYLRRGSGYYIDVGAAELVADGRVKLAHGEVDHLTETDVVLEDGTELPADLVVYATGYGSMNGWVADIVDQATADKVGKVWGWARTPPRTRARGRASSATCGSPPSRRTSGSAAATCTSPGTIRSTWPCSSRPATRASRPRSTDSRNPTTSTDERAGRGIIPAGRFPYAIRRRAPLPRPGRPADPRSRRPVGRASGRRRPCRARCSTR
jgi:hypothetical protein